MKNDIKFVYFDVGGVIFRWREVLEGIAKNYGRKADEILRVFVKYDEAACRGLITSQQIWQKMHRELRISPKKDFDFFKFSLEKFAPITETHEFVKEIAEYLQVGLLTNIHPGVFDQVKKLGHIPNINYSVIIQSCQIGLIKPEKEIYEHAQKKAKVKARHILFIDDTEINIKGAEVLGWNTVLFDTNNPARSIREIRKWIKH